MVKDEGCGQGGRVWSRGSLTAMLIAVEMMVRWLETMTSLKPPATETSVTSAMAGLGADHASFSWS